MSGKKFDKILCVDLEATCYENGAFPEGEVQDIIEIGVAELNLKTYEITNNQGILIRPNQSTVSNYCTELTSLTYKQLKSEGCPNYAQAINRLIKLYGPKNRAWASWGNYDKWGIERDCKKYAVKYPFGSTHINVKDLYTIWTGRVRGLGLGAALDQEDLSRDGRAHRGYVDAHWVAQIFRHILQGKVLRK